MNVSDHGLHTPTLDDPKTSSCLGRSQEILSLVWPSHPQIVQRQPEQQTQRQLQLEPQRQVHLEPQREPQEQHVEEPRVNYKEHAFNTINDLLIHHAALQEGEDGVKLNNDILKKMWKEWKPIAESREITSYEKFMNLEHVKEHHDIGKGIKPWYDK